MLVGKALFKVGVFSAKWPKRRYWAMIASAVFVGIPVTLYGTHRDFASGWDFRYCFLLVSMGWVGAIMLVCKAAPLVPITHRFAAVGNGVFELHHAHRHLHDHLLW